jgi:hypothetical protein
MGLEVNSSNDWPVVFFLFIYLFILFTFICLVPSMMVYEEKKNQHKRQPMRG